MRFDPPTKYGAVDEQVYAGNRGGQIGGKRFDVIDAIRGGDMFHGNRSPAWRDGRDQARSMKDSLAARKYRRWICQPRRAHRAAADLAMASTRARTLSKFATPRPNRRAPRYSLTRFIRLRHGCANIHRIVSSGDRSVIRARTAIPIRQAHDRSR